ncbi:MAG: SDR family NAD(P)-dependent oxidoreductase [Bacteroidetes bacterium]|nr:SDR family NAD(P)-dependent oxidoreductase [Bacteroidota bacterium]
MIKRAIVSGSTSGIGKATAIALCRDGYSITLIARDIEKLNEVKSQLDQLSTNNHNFIKIDFEQENIIEALADVQFLKADKLVLVNNVGGHCRKMFPEIVILRIIK